MPRRQRAHRQHQVPVRAISQVSPRREIPVDGRPVHDGDPGFVGLEVEVDKLEEEVMLGEDEGRLGGDGCFDFPL